MSHALRLLLTLGVVVLLAGCGGSDGDDAAAPPPEPKPTARAEDFPAAEGRSLPDIIQGLQEGPALAPSVQVLDKGRNRVGFALFDDARKQLSGAPVALYIGSIDGSRARGPFVARSESLAVKPQFQSRQNAEDPDAAKSVYVADVEFPRTGKYAILGLVNLDGRLVTTDPFAMEVGGKGATPPDVGDRAPVIHTQTRADVAGDLSKIDTRVPPLPELHDADFADVVGKKPVVLTFATPQLCASKVCGPVVDVVAQVRSAVGGGVEFIHQEIYNDNKVDKGFRSQVADWRLPTEPWTFVVGADGRIAARFEGAFSAGELERAVLKVKDGTP